jgi:hypothetical protein
MTARHGGLINVLLTNFFAGRGVDSKSRHFSKRNSSALKGRKTKMDSKNRPGCQKSILNRDKLYKGWSTGGAALRRAGLTKRRKSEP